MRRRTLLKLTAAAPIAVSSTPLLAGCASVTGAVPYLNLLARESVKGFGMLVGTDAAQGATELGSHALAWLQDEVDAKATSTVYAFSPELTETNPLRLLVASAFDVDGKLVSDAVIENGREYVQVPSVVALGVAFFARRRFEEWTADHPRASRREARTVQRELRHAYSIRKLQRRDGSEDLTRSSVYDALTTNDRNLRVVWDPTDDQIEQTRLQVFEGVILKGRDPQWSYNYERGIPSDDLWGNAARA